MLTDVANCLCATDEDGFVTVCDHHRVAMHHNEYRYRSLLDAELDEVVREIAGRSPTRIERKPGAVGDFAIRKR